MQTKLPAKGQSPALLLQTLESFKAQDLPWQSGRVFGYVYDAGAESQQLLRQAYSNFLSENALDPTVFPSLLKLENDVVGIAANLLHGDTAVGNFTTGGTESIMLALKTARDFAHEKSPQITQPEVVLPHTAHAAFHKACHFLGLKPVVIPVDLTTFRAIPEQFREVTTENTILWVASAPSYAHGVIDPIEAIAQLALQKKVLFHVDACVGGFYLPFAQQLGYPIPAFDFSVKGVTSMSADFHKFGYAAKGASVVLHHHADMRKYQLFVNSSWAGYTMINTTVLSTKSGGSLAACWAILHYLGTEGYQQHVAATMQATQQIRQHLANHPHLFVLGNPDMNLLAIASRSFSVFRLADAMRRRGWYVQPQLASASSVDNIHLSVNPSNVPHIAAFLQDLDAAVAEIVAEAKPAVDLAPVMAILQSGAPDALAQISALLGISGQNLPDDLEAINTLLSQLPPPVREFFLKDFANQLYVD